MLIINLSAGTLDVDVLSNSVCDESPTLKRNTHTSLNTRNPNSGIPLFLTQFMVDQVSNLNLIVPVGVRTFSLSDESGIDLSTSNPHSQPFASFLKKEPNYCLLPKERETLTVG